MNWYEYVAIVSLFVGFWNQFYELTLFKRRPGFTEYQDRVHASYKLSTTNAAITTLFCVGWWLELPFVKQLANASLAAYFIVDYATLLPYNYWEQHKDQKFHHFLCVVNITCVMLLEGAYLEYGSHYSLVSEVSTIFANIRWFMLKKAIKTDPVIFSINKTMFVVSFFAVRIVYGGLNTYNIWQDQTVYQATKFLGVIYCLLNVCWSVKVYQLMPRVLQMTLFSFSCSIWALFFLESPMSQTLAKLEILIAIVSAIYWNNPIRGWRRNLDIFVTLSVFGIHTAVCFYFQFWSPILCYLSCLLFWKLGHVYDSNSLHLGVHVMGFIGTCLLHLRLKSN